MTFNAIWFCFPEKQATGEGNVNLEDPFNKYLITGSNILHAVLMVVLVDVR